MRIAIDTRWIRNEIPDGIGRVALEMTKELLKLKEKNENFLLLYHDSNIKKWLEDEFKADQKGNIKWLRVNYPILSVKDFILLPFFLRKQKIDIYYTFNYLTSWFHRGYKTIVTVHDLIPYIFKPDFKEASLKWKLFFGQKFFTRKIFKKADIIISDSKSTKGDIIKIFNILENKIRVVPIGITNFKDKYHKKMIEKDYILYVGRKDTYKNLKTLISAYIGLETGIKEKYYLVIAGKKDEFQTRLLKKEIDGGIEQNNIVFFDDVNNKKLVSLYKHASLFVYPSLYEGFGLPPLEAMSLGVPVLASNIPSLQEVLGDAALFVNPRDINDIKKKIIKLLSDKNIKNDMINKGYEQIKKFSWQESAKKIIKIFEEVYPVR